MQSSKQTRRSPIRTPAVVTPAETQAAVGSDLCRPAVAAAAAEAGQVLLVEVTPGTFKCNVAVAWGFKEPKAAVTKVVSSAKATKVAAAPPVTTSLSDRRSTLRW